MTPVLCRVGHDPSEGKVGDCVRACIATILDLQAEEVPHFYHDDCDGLTGHARVKEWLAGRGLVPFIGMFPPGPVSTVFDHMATDNPTVTYILIGTLEGGGRHAVVCTGGCRVHNPAWLATPFADDGEPWVIMVIARL